SAGDKSLTLSGNNSGDNTVAAGLSDPPNSGTLRLSKTGAGRWILSGSDSYTGLTTITTGELVVRGPAGKISGSNIVVSQNGILTLDGGTISSPSVLVSGAFNFRSGTLNLGNLNSAFR